MLNIKYRMWSGPSEKFFNSSHAFYCMAQQAAFDEKAKYLHALPCDHLSDGTFFEQWIGVIDGDGTDVYEGDLIKDSTGKVRIVERTLGIRNRLAGHGETSAEVLNGWNFCFHTKEEWDSIKVVGNVHQNSELIP